MLASSLGAPAIAGIALIVLIDVTCLVICLLKGKYWFGLIGLLLHPFWYVGAIRLAKPDSSWARRYDEAKLAVARERFAG